MVGTVSVYEHQEFAHEMDFGHGPTLHSVRYHLERMFAVGPLGSSRYAPTGEEYVEICSGGVKGEGESCPALCSTKIVAIRLWRDAVRDYAKGKSGTLYWRILPELDYVTCRAEDDETHRLTGPDVQWRVYSRLLISDKPPHVVIQDDSDTTRVGKVLVRCDCTCGDPCPNGRRGSEARCQVWVERRHLTEAKVDATRRENRFDR